MFGDPHISTFDRLRFACQASGVFTTVTSLETAAFLIQELFSDAGSSICSQVSVSTGVAIREVDLPVIQISVLFVGGALATLTNGTGMNSIQVSVAGSSITVRYPFTGVQVLLTVRSSGTFGCFFQVQVVPQLATALLKQSLASWANQMVFAVTIGFHQTGPFLLLRKPKWIASSVQHTIIASTIGV